MLIDTQIIKLDAIRFASRVSDAVFGIPFPEMKRVRQKTVSHCGPAAIEMLLSFLGKKVSQDKLVSKTGSSRKWFEMHGTNVQELANSVKKTFPNLVFWYKKESSLKDLSRAINEFGHPVGIEWQGIFDYEDIDYDPSYGEEDDDPGHYCVATAINNKKGTMRIADPERHYAGNDRRIAVSVFKKRWWDTNDFKIKGTGKIRKIKDVRMMFVITSKKDTWPKKLRMVKAS